MLRADTTASVFDDEEKRARATTQVHKVAREGYRSDAGGSASWAGCDRTTTLVAGARHVQTSSLSARDVPTQPRRFAPSCGPSGRLHAPKSREAMPLVCLSDLGNGPTLDDLAMGSGSEFSLRRSRTACCADFVLYGSGTTRGTPESGRSKRYCERTGISHKQRRILPPSQRSNRLACCADAALVCLQANGPTLVTQESARKHWSG
jgi:hypothetical protein